MAATAFGIYCFKVTNKEEKEQALTIGIYSSKSNRIVAVADYLSRFPLKEEIIYDLNNTTRSCSYIKKYMTNMSM
jgi:hypothetical protein